MSTIDAFHLNQAAGFKAQGRLAEAAQAYSMLNNEPMANLATAEQWYNIGDMRKALVFATRARGKLPQGTADWERAQDIIGASAALARQQRG